MGESKLADRLKTSLDELRMQVLGAQVLFGFQFQSLFQPGFDCAAGRERLADAASLGTILLSFTALVVPPIQHRIVERGEATRRLLTLTSRCAEFALVTMAIALGCIAFAIANHEDFHYPYATALATMLGAGALWLGWRWLPIRVSAPMREEQAMTDLHTKIDQMLTEARVILPGAQAMLGFQLIVIMTEAFGKLSPPLQHWHFCALALDAFSVVLLITPAAAHRLSFQGSDDVRFHRIGSWLVSLALLPLMLSLALEVYIAAWKLSSDPLTAACSAVAALLICGGAWYVFPWLAYRHLARRWAR